MYLTELTLHGFKSFAKRSDLTFPGTVTAIVGPNGSGKSNVAEALRFVLGEQSVKSLRGKRGEDLIWGGSEALSRANRASVAITINNEQRVLPLDTDTITIERIVHRDGQNEYKINQQGVRLKDVHELLAAGNIGPSGHHIISQGEADRVLSATPLERRSMIEDALGLKVYQYKKSDAEKKLAKTEQNITEVGALRKEIAPHLAYLKRELDTQAEAKALRIELHDAYAEYLKREDVYLANQYDTCSGTLAEVERSLAECTEAITKLAANTETEPQEDAGEQERTELYQALTAVRSERMKVAERYNHVSGRHAALQEQAAALEQEPDDVMVPLATIDEHVSELETALEQAKQSDDPSTIKHVCAKAVAAIRSFITSKQKDPKDERRTAVQARIDAVEQETQDLAAELEQIQVREQEAQDAYDAAVAARDKQHQEVQHATKELYEQKAARAELEAKQRQYQHELSIIERERQAFKDELQEAVALLGRGAAQYFNQTVYDEQGEAVDAEAICAEDREAQRNRKRALEKMKIRLETIGDGTGEDIEKEYETTKERDDFLARELADLEASVTTLETLIKDLDGQIDEQFQVGFQKIQKEFQNFFALMFGGGTAELRPIELAAADDADEDTDLDAPEPAPSRGIDLTVQLPNKRIQGLAMLSGGERALTSIALIFAMSQIHPPLFIVLDETDAALDEANSRRYGDLIEALAERSQLILITHNRETMSRAGVLYGVTMGANGVSKLLSVQLDDAVAHAK